MSRTHRYRRAAAGVFACCALGCGENPVEPPEDHIASVEVSSAIDTIVAVGRATQLAATARDQSGRAISGASFLWTSSDGAILNVDAAGMATAEAPGRATITAAVDGSGASGGIALRTVDADLDAVGLLGSDLFAAALVSGLSSGVHSEVEPAWAACAEGAGPGNVAAIVGCVDDLRGGAESADASPTDRALLAVLALFADRIESQLAL